MTITKNTNSEAPGALAALFVVAMTLLGAVLVGTRTLQADAIVQTNGTRKEGVRITKATWDQVLYTEGQNTFQLAGDKIASIERDSSAISRIRGPLEAGDYAKAMSQVKRAEGGVQGWELAEVTYLKGKVYLEAGKFREADRVLADYVAANGTNKDFWIPHAVEARGQAALARKTGGTAAQHFTDLAKYGPTWTLRATLGQAEGNVLKKNAAKARELFSKVSRDRRAPPGLKSQALVGRVRVMVMEQQYEAAIRELEKTFFKGSDPALLNYGPARAKAAYLMGISHQKQGGKENLELAEVWFLRTAVLYRAHPVIYRDACSELSNVYTALKRNDRAAEWKKRASTGS